MRRVSWTVSVNEIDMKNMTHNNRWLVRRPIAAPRLRLFCFAHAGGRATDFLPWQAQLDPHVEVCGVQLPGRGARWSEEPRMAMPLLVETVARVIERHADVPFALFGHSLGAILAFEVARYCQSHGLPVPVHLLVSGCSAPGRFGGQQWHTLDDDELIGILKRLNGTPAEFLEQEELMQLVLPMLRADFELVGTYAYCRGPRLHMPITALAGVADEHVRLDSFSGWEDETHAGYDQFRFEGGHFFVQERSAEVVACLMEKLGF
jgi:surfactin synthase thioesterase subunit